MISLAKRAGLVVALAAGMILGAGTVSAADDDAPLRPTFNKDVLPILQSECQACHRPGGRNMSGMIAPMSFTTYRETRPWAKAIARVVEEREMPPWDASEAQHGLFANERVLDQGQIETILAWVRGGAPRGDPGDAPEPITWKEGWYMGEPDLVVAFPEAFFVEDDVQDLYHNVTVTLSEDQIPEDKWVQSIEFRPGSDVVHHIIIYASNPEDESKPADEDADVESDQDFLGSRVMLGGLAPGTDPGIFPDGFGIPLKMGAELTFAMHYHKEAGPGTGVWDKSTVAFQFTDGKPKHEMNVTTIAHGAFEIPPNHPHWVVSGAKTFKEDILLLNLMPHSHIRGVEARYIAHYPDGTTETLLEVPKYDFNWQSYYLYKEPKLIPAGTRIEYETVYDNSPENAERVGFNSNRAVRFGGPTTDEMDLGWYTYSSAKPQGDQSGD